MMSEGDRWRLYIHLAILARNAGSLGVTALLTYEPLGTKIFLFFHKTLANNPAGMLTTQ